MGIALCCTKTINKLVFNGVTAEIIKQEITCQCRLERHTAIYNAFFMDLLVSSFVFHSYLLTVKGVDLAVACNGF